MRKSGNKKSAAVVLILKDIRPEHTLFALPFAFAGAFLAFRHAGFFVDGNFNLPAFLWKIIWIVAATLGARSAAMAFNRLVDADIDALNPRTASRPLPSRRAGKNAYALFIAASLLLFIAAAGMLNETCLALSPAAIVVVLGYSLTKRFTALTHFFLGLALALAPLGAWLAVTGGLSAPAVPLLLAGAVLFWVAGFDMIYACQDFDVDARLSVHSFPKSLGIRRTLWASGASHVAMVALLAALWAAAHWLGWIFLAGLGIAVLLLALEHAIVKPANLKRVNTAFFELNALVSAVLAAAIILDSLL